VPTVAVGTRLSGEAGVSIVKKAVGIDMPSAQQARPTARPST
jgi:hypothetical protein